jgi:lipopolysaccharide heptosyltransferase I
LTRRERDRTIVPMPANDADRSDSRRSEGVRGTGRRGRRRILVVRLSAIGDVLHALPAVAALRRALPDAEIDWVVEDKAADLLRGRPDLDRVFVYERRLFRSGDGEGGRRGGAVRSAMGLVRALRRRRYHVAIDLQGNLKSGVIARLSGAPVRWGFDRRSVREGNAWFTSRRIPPLPRRAHRVERNLALVSAVLGRPAAYAEAGIAPSAEAAARVEKALAERGLPPRGFALLHPGTSAFGAFKRWPTDSFARLARRIVAETGASVVVTQGPGEAALAEAALARLTGPARARAGVLPAEDLRDLAEAIRRARVFVAADTGPLHVAAAVGTPLLGLFGPKDEAVYGPYGSRPSGGAPGPLPVLVNDDVPCRPCTLRWCPDPVCMTSLSPDDVFDRVRVHLP